MVKWRRDVALQTRAYSNDDANIVRAIGRGDFFGMRAHFIHHLAQRPPKLALLAAI
jgi:hypothetical protein